MTASDCMAVGALGGMVLLVAIFAWAVGYADGCRERDTDEIEIGTSPPIEWGDYSQQREAQQS